MLYGNLGFILMVSTGDQRVVFEFTKTALGKKNDRYEVAVDTTIGQLFGVKRSIILRDVHRRYQMKLTKWLNLVGARLKYKYGVLITIS